MKILRILLKSVAVLLPGIAFMLYYNLRMEAQHFQPYIYTITGRKVLVARIKGDPDITIDTARTINKCFCFKRMFNLCVCKLI